MCPSKCFPERFPGKYWVIPHFSPTNSTSTFLKLSALRRFYHYIPDAIRRCQVTIVISSCRPRLQWIVLICEGLLRLVRSLLLRDRGSAYSGVRLLRTTAVPPPAPLPLRQCSLSRAHISILMTEQPAQPALTRNSLSSGVCKKSPESPALFY